MESWADFIASYVQATAKQVVDLFPDWSSLPPVSNPVVLMLKASDAAMNAGVSVANDFSLKGQGIERFSPLPAGYMPPDEQQSRDIQNHGTLTAVDMYATRAKQIATDAVNTVADLVTPAPGSLPVWVKLTIAAAVIIGTAAALNSFVSGRRYA